MVLAGCLSPTTAGWGVGDGEVKVEFTTDSASATSSLGDEKESFDELSPIGCNETRSLDNGGNPIKFTGYMAASHFYTSHDELYGASDLDLAVTASVAIKSMSMKDAAIVDGEQIPRVQVKNWILPLYPNTGAGNVDLDEIDMDSDSRWFVLGLIPTSENILYGMQALGEWHQPVQIEGYLLETNSTSSAGYFSNWHEVNENCEMGIGQNNIESVYLMVTSIKFQDSVVTSSGDSSDEWVLGDVPYLGRGGFITFFLIFGIGGAVVMFMFSKIAVSKGAAHSMEILVGKKAMAAVSKVKSDIKRAKSEGMTTSRQRNAEARKDAANEVKEDKKPKKKGTEDSDALVGFDLDSALQSSSNEPTSSEFGSKGSSVVATSEAQSIASQSSSSSRKASPQKSTTTTSSANVAAPTTTRSSVVSNTEPAPSKRSHFSSAVSGSSTHREEPKKKVVKKRATKKAQQPKAEPWQGKKEESSNTFEEEEEEDFSDFSI